MGYGKKLIDPTWGFSSMRAALLADAPTLKALAEKGGPDTIAALAEYFAVWWEWWGTEAPAERLRIELAAEICRHFGALKLSELKFALHQMLRTFQPYGKVAPADVLRHLQGYRQRRQSLLQHATYEERQRYFRRIAADRQALNGTDRKALPEK